MFRNRETLWHHERAHPSRGQHLLLRSAIPVRNAHRGPVLRVSRVPPSRQRHGYGRLSVVQLHFDAVCSRSNSSAARVLLLRTILLTPVRHYLCCRLRGPQCSCARCQGSGLEALLAIAVQNWSCITICAARENLVKCTFTLNGIGPSP